jgi:hypothetical protein
MGFDEELDEDFIWMGMIATWQGQETMERGVSERKDPSIFLAYTIKWREAARHLMKMN